MDKTGCTQGKGTRRKAWLTVCVCIYRGICGVMVREVGALQLSLGVQKVGEGRTWRKRQDIGGQRSSVRIMVCFGIPEWCGAVMEENTGRLDQARFSKPCRSFFLFFLLLLLLLLLFLFLLLLLV